MKFQPMFIASFLFYETQKEKSKNTLLKVLSPFSKSRCLAFAKDSFGIEKQEFPTAFIEQ